MNGNFQRNRRIMWALFALLVVLHHDWWFWNDGRLLFGFLPIGLGYHMLISIAAGALWGWAAWRAWPDDAEATALLLPATAGGNHQPHGPDHHG